MQLVEFLMKTRPYACHERKNQGRGRYCYFDPQQTENQLSRRSSKPKTLTVLSRFQDPLKIISPDQIKDE